MAHNKKLLIFYVYNVLKEYSDERHPMKQQEIADKITRLFGMECERKAIGANIEALREDLGFDIVTERGRGVYLGARTFARSEASSLVDALFSSRELSSREARELAKKVFADFSVHERRQYKYIYKSEQSSHSSRQLFYTIDELCRAIAKRKRVSFDYITYGAGGSVRTSVTVHPYYLINSNGKYDLICAARPEEGLTPYRVEYMEGIRVLDGENGTKNEPAVPIAQVKGCGADFDITAYANEGLSMFGGRAVRAEIRLIDSRALTFVYDWFGKEKTKVRRNERGALVVTVKVGEQALISWLLQYGEWAELLTPGETREKVKGIVERMAARYR